MAAKFKRASATLTKSESTIYTAPATGAIIIGVLAAHNGATEAAAQLQLKIKPASGNAVYMLGKDTSLPQKSALNIDSGKVILMNGDQVIASASAVDTSNNSNMVDLTLSIMEN